jgi:hypothetical protein
MAQMAMAELREAAKRFHDHEERARAENRIRPDEFDLLAKLVLQAVREMANMERRLRTLEGIPLQPD